MQGPDGTEMPQQGVFNEIQEPELIATSAEFEVGAPSPHRMKLTYRFEDQGDKTKFTMIITHATVEMRREHQAMGVVEGWNLNWDSLDAYIPTLVS